MTSKCVFYWLLAVLLAAMLCIGSVTAASDIRNVESGSAAFVFEKITVENHAAGHLNMAMFNTGVYSIVNQISSDTKGVFNLDVSIVGANYGTYYLTDTWNDSAPFIVSGIRKSVCGQPPAPVSPLTERPLTGTR